MAGDQRRGSPIVERASGSRVKLALVVGAAMFAFWQLRQLPGGAPVARQPAEPTELAAVAPSAARPLVASARAPDGAARGDAVHATVLAVVGRRYESLAALDAALAGRDFARVGRFGEAWPATVIQARTGFETVELEHAGQVHRYTGFAGADLLALGLAGDAGESVSLVYRRRR